MLFDTNVTHYASSSTSVKAVKAVARVSKTPTPTEILICVLPLRWSEACTVQSCDTAAPHLLLWPHKEQPKQGAETHQSQGKPLNGNEMLPFPICQHGLIYNYDQLLHHAVAVDGPCALLLDSICC